MFSQGFCLNPREHLLGTHGRGLKELIRRPEGIEDHVAVREEVMAVFRAHPDGIRKHPQRKGLGQFRTAVKLTFGD
jgi:hypothetical protein